MPTSFESWPPAGWDSWSAEQRRIWHLEQDKLKLEAFFLAAADYAHDLGAELPAARGEEPPTGDEANEAISRSSRADRGRRWPMAHDA